MPDGGGSDDGGVTEQTPRIVEFLAGKATQQSFSQASGVRRHGKQKIIESVVAPIGSQELPQSNTPIL